MSKYEYLILLLVMFVLGASLGAIIARAWYTS